MPKKTAILVDGGFLCKKITKSADPSIQAKRIVSAATLCLDQDEELFRIFYYDCGPFDRTDTDLSGNRLEF